MTDLHKTLTLFQYEYAEYTADQDPCQKTIKSLMSEYLTDLLKKNGPRCFS